MAVNPMQRKSRNSFLLGMLLMLVIGAIAVGFLIYQMSELQDELAIKEAKTGYVLLQDVQSGETLSTNMVKQVKMEYAPTDALTIGDISGNELKAKTDLKSGVVISADMVYIVGEETKKDTRIQEYNMVTLPAKLETGQYIDIRLTLPSGQDFIVVSKKEVLSCDTTTIWLQMSEDEIMMMNNAIGSNLYATTYTEPGMQEASTPTYAVSSYVASTLQASPNLLQEAIIAYNERSATAQSNRTEIERALSQYNDVRKENVEEGVDKSRTQTVDSRIKYIGTLNAEAY